MLKKDYNRVIAAYKSGVSEEVCLSMMTQLILKSLKNVGIVNEYEDTMVVDVTELTSDVSRWTAQFIKDIRAIRSDA